jgi:hypothetical protein
MWGGGDLVLGLIRVVPEEQVPGSVELVIRNA